MSPVFKNLFSNGQRREKIIFFFEKALIFFFCENARKSWKKRSNNNNTCLGICFSLFMSKFNTYRIHISPAIIDDAKFAFMNLLILNVQYVQLRSANVFLILPSFSFMHLKHKCEKVLTNVNVKFDCTGTFQDVA